VDTLPFLTVFSRCQPKYHRPTKNFSKFVFSDKNT